MYYTLLVNTSEIYEISKNEIHETVFFGTNFENSQTGLQIFKTNMGNGSSSSKDHVKGPGLFSVQSASGALPEFVDFYDRPEKKWKVRDTSPTFFFFSRKRNVRNTARTST